MAASGTDIRNNKSAVKLFSPMIFFQRWLVTNTFSY